MRTASITNTKTSFSEYVKIVARTGNDLLITERGRVVARISPPLSIDTSDDQRLCQLEQEGLIRRGSGHIPADFWDMPAPGGIGGEAVKALLAEREEGL